MCGRWWVEASPHNQNGQKRKHGGGDPHPTTPLYLVLKTHEGANWAQVASAKWGGDYFQNLSIQQSWYTARLHSIYNCFWNIDTCTSVSVGQSLRNGFKHHGVHSHYIGHILNQGGGRMWILDIQLHYKLRGLQPTPQKKETSDFLCQKTYSIK